MQKEQTWNPELVVSGIAMYVTAYLPDAFYWGYYYISNEIRFQEELYNLFLGLAYKASLAGSYMLLIGFGIHFLLRAIWVSLLGINVVFPKDINYDAIPRLSEERKQLLSTYLGSMQEATNRLDKTCSTILSLTFLFFIFMFNIGSLYFAILLVIIASDYFFTDYKYIIIGIFLVLAVFVSLTGYLSTLKRFQQYKQFSRWTHYFTVYAGGFVLPWGYKIYLRLFYLFYSNVSQRVFNSYAIVSGILLYIVLIIAVTVNPNRTEEFVVFSFMHPYYAKKSHYDDYFKNYYYDNLRPEKEKLTVLSLEKDVLKKDEYLRLFWVYNTLAEKALSEQCTLSSVDSLRTSSALKCWSSVLKITINDKECKNLRWFFATHPQTKEKGLVVYIAPKYFQEDYNELRLNIKLNFEILGIKKEKNTYLVPFWVSL
ncbi:MAG: hypothetical protein EAZ55_00180 [Cytophagales bacterium]|nr:MAG: hypothetical protein EAZ55_00180 [Cytophagales bacterium]